MMLPITAKHNLTATRRARVAYEWRALVIAVQFVGHRCRRLLAALTETEAADA